MLESISVRERFLDWSTLTRGMLIFYVILVLFQFHFVFLLSPLNHLFVPYKTCFAWLNMLKKVLLVKIEFLLLHADLGVKTKTQLMAEKSSFKTFFITILAANSSSDLHVQMIRMMLIFVGHLLLLLL